jgi:hypothetical protein
MDADAPGMLAPPPSGDPQARQNRSCQGFGTPQEMQGTAGSTVDQ